MRKPFNEILKALREERGLSQQELADALDITRSTLGNYEVGLRSPNMEMLEAIADYFNVDMDFLYGKTKIKNKYQESLKSDGSDLPSNILPIAKKKFPLLGSIACGEPIFADEDFEGYVEAGANIDADFCLRANGDSMIGARIHDGDIVFIKQQPLVENGQIAAVLIDDEATLKRFYYDKANQIIQLMAENPAYPPIIKMQTDLESIRILGRAIAFQSNIL